MIDTSASKHLITGYRKYFAYIREIEDTAIDIAKTITIHI